MENRLSREAAQARRHSRMSRVAVAMIWAIICRLAKVQTEAAKESGSEKGKRKECRHCGGRQGWEEGDMLGQQYHPDVSHRTYCQQTSNITHWLIRLEERRWQQWPWSRRMEDAHYSETDREDAAGVSTYDGTESLRACTVHRQQLLCFPPTLSDQGCSISASNPPHFYFCTPTGGGKKWKKNNKFLLAFFFILNNIYR